MIKEVHITQMKKKFIEDPTTRFYVVMKKPPESVRFDQMQECPVLAPSTEILEKLKSCQLTWGEYKEKYLKELQSPIAKELMKFITQESKKKDVYFVCGCESGDRCHRFILLSVMDNFSRRAQRGT
jgi:uncharacterized protein YeaO (DUF488 family)